VSQIIGIVLVRNEDRFVRRAVLNVLEFCDRIFLVDHGSEDLTASILKRVVEEHPGRVSFHAIRHPRESHEILKPFVGTAAWVFAVDGDEIYDPAGLGAFRLRLISGEFDRHWMILGNVHHCERFDPGRGEAEGFATPPCRSITKLYNFAAIRSWDGDTPERLHGGAPDFLPGFDEQNKRQLQLEYGWENSPLRCLHMCFVPRSSLDREAGSSRENIMETYCGGWTNRVVRSLRRLCAMPEKSDWKRERYARGERLVVPTAPFL